LQVVIYIRVQQIATLDRQTGELIERRSSNERREARAFHAALEAPRHPKASGLALSAPPFGNAK